MIFAQRCCIAVTAAAALVPRPAPACGGVVTETDVVTPVTMDAQIAVMSAHDGVTDVVFQVSIPETTSDYGVLLPVPDVPTLDPNPISSEDLRSLEAATRPAVYVYGEASGEGGGGCGCWPGSAADAGGQLGGSVEVLDVVDIGPVTAVVLSGDTAAELGEWLTDNGFAVPADAQSTIDAHLAAGDLFVALKRNDTVTDGSTTSIGVHLTVPGSHLGYPLRISRMGAAETLHIVALVAAAEARGPAGPFAQLTLDDLDPTSLENGDYEGAVRTAVAERDGRAFVVEGLFQGSELGLAGTDLEGVIPEELVLARLTTVMASSALTEDVAFTAVIDGDPPRERHVQAPPGSGPRSPFSSLWPVVLAAGWASHRSRRRRVLAVC